MAVRSERQRVLVIDRHDAVLNWYRRVLSREGYAVEVATDDEDALARTAGQPVDAVISDVPADGSPETRARTLRRIDSAGPQLRIAATLPALSENDLRSADLLGAQMIFTHPLNAERVVASVRKLLMPMPVVYDTPPPDAGPLAYPVQRNPE
jgi:two-component system response regulator MprA